MTVDALAGDEVASYAADAVVDVATEPLLVYFNALAEMGQAMHGSLGIRLCG